MIPQRPTTDWTSHHINIVSTLQQKSDGRIRHPYTYYRSILNHQPNIDQLWAPSRHVFIFPPATTTAYQPTSSSLYPTTTHMDVFQPQNTHHHNTDQFLITINTNTTSQKSNIAIYNLWDDQNHSAFPRRSIVSSRLLPQRGRPQHDYHQVNDTEAPLEFRPIQETLFTTTSTATATTGRNSQNHLLSGLQWYPIDTGTFITTTISNGGYVTLWDTNHMIPVLSCQPYLIMNQNSNAAMTTTQATGRGYTGSRSIPYGRAFGARTTGVQGRGRPGQRSILHANDYNANYPTSHNGTASGIATMHIGTPQPYLVATGSHRSDMTKIVDLRSGSTSHTLMIGTSTSFMYDRDHTGHSSRHHRDHHQCVTSVQWSPIQSNTLATCTNGNCYVWDIRSTVQPIAIGQYDGHCTNRKDGISVACHSMDAHLSQRRRRGTTRDGPPPPASTRSHYIQEFYETLKFDHTGQYLITLSKMVKDPSTAYMTVFDLLSPSLTSEVPVRLVASTRQYYSNNGPRHDRCSNVLHSSILFLTGRTATDQNVWFSASDSTRLTSYPMRPDHPDDDDDSQPRNELIGHMGRIRCGAVMTGPNGLRQRPSGTRVNQQLIYTPHTIVTAADDGVMLVWEQQQLLPLRNQPDDSDSNHPNKRPRLSRNQQLPRPPPASATGDYDTWI